MDRPLKTEQHRLAITRRRMVTVAGHTAWTAPLILSASTAHAATVVSGAANIITGQPTFTIPTSHIRASTPFRNASPVGTAPSMTVTVLIKPTQGTLQDRDPTVTPASSSAFAFTGRVNNQDGSQTLTFTKLSPQIGPNMTATLTFDFYQNADPGTGFRAGTFTITPSVPPPSTATGSAEDYLSTVSA